MRQTTPLIERRLAAYHEAGHAVAAFVLKRPMTPLSLQSQDSGAAATSRATNAGNDAAFPVPGADDAERDAIVLLAGAEAEALLTADCDWYAAAADRERAEELLAHVLATGERIEPHDEEEAELVGDLGDAPLLRAWELVRSRTYALVHEPPVRSAIAAVAASLLASGTLDVAQIQRAIRQGIASADPDLDDPT